MTPEGSAQPRQASRVAVLGAGITGLTAAYELHSLARKRGRTLEVSILEAGPGAGGKVVTKRVDGLILEGGPDSFLAKPSAMDLIKELGLSGELVESDVRHQWVYVYSRGRLRRLPAGMNLIAPSRMLPFVFSDLISWKGKFRAVLEPWVKPSDDLADESLADFVRRRLGPEVLDVIAAPLLSGIFAGDAEAMSLASTFPQLRDMEKKGGLLRSARALAQPAAKRGMFVTLKGGLSRLTETLLAKLPPETLKPQTRVLGLSRRGSVWNIRTDKGVLEAQAVISTLPASSLADVTADLDGELSNVLREIPFASTGTVSLAYDAKDLPAPWQGFGFLVPRSEGKAITAATFTSNKFPGRVPEGRVLIRCFLGGAGRDPDSVSGEASMVKRVREELSEILGLRAEPKLAEARRWPAANPQYNVGHALRLDRIDSCLKGHPGLFAAGCSYRGVGLPDCIASGRSAAAAALELKY